MNVKTLDLVVPLALVGALFVTLALGAPPRSDSARELVIAAPSVAVSTPPAIASLPTLAAPKRQSPTPLPTTTPTQPTPTPPDPRPNMLMLPTLAPTPAPTPTPTATSEAVPAAASRVNCDPAYPEARTCIPPGPPFNQGCAVTDQRLFTVLPPDPQGLDHDKDGIGCEPIARRP